MTLKKDLEQLILKYGTSRIIEELANFTLEGSSYLADNGFFNTEMIMRQRATKLFSIASERKNWQDRENERTK